MIRSRPSGGPGVASACGGLRGARAHGPRGGLEDDLGGAAAARGGLQPRKGGSRRWDQSRVSYWEMDGNGRLINSELETSGKVWFWNLAIHIVAIPLKAERRTSW